MHDFKIILSRVFKKISEILLTVIDGIITSPTSRMTFRTRDDPMFAHKCQSSRNMHACERFNRPRNRATAQHTRLPGTPLRGGGLSPVDS